MDILHGKKALCFIALPHHNRFLLPIMQALSDRGMEVVYVTAAAEGAFEITLNQAGLPYRHALDYATQETGERASAAFRALRPVLQEKMLANQVLQAVPLPIQDKVIRSAVENVYCFERMLEAEKPDLLFALHELNPWGKILGYLSHVHHAPYITLQEGLYYASTYYYRFHTDYSTACVVWGEACRQVLLAAGCSTDKIFALGNTHIWEARQQATESAAVAAARAALGIGPEKKIILFLMSHANYKPFEPSRFLNWLEARREVVAIFKWHPVTGKDIIERALKPVLSKVEGNLKETPSTLRQGSGQVLSLQDFDTYTLLGISDVCVTVGNSTTGLEALVFDKPLIEVRLPDQDYSFADQGVAEQAQGFEDVGDKVEAILAQGLPPGRRQKIKQYLAHHFSFLDDGTVERIVEMVAEMLRARERSRAKGLELSPEPLALSPEARFPCSLILPIDDTSPTDVLATLKGIVAHVPPELFEILMVNAAANQETRNLLSSLEGDVQVIAGEPEWSFSECCNRAAAEARGKYLVFLKPGLIPCPGWLEGLLSAAEEEKDLNQRQKAKGKRQKSDGTDGIDGTDEIGVVGGRVVNENSLLWHLGVAFDVNNSPFSLYRLLPPEFAGARKQREFKAVQIPFLVSREQFCRLGGFNTDLVNRFEDIDLCLRIREAGLRVLYTPRGTILRAAASWEPTPQQDHMNRIRFYARWTGSLWQDDDRYLAEDSLDHDTLTALYRELAVRVAVGAQAALAQMQE